MRTTCDHVDGRISAFRDGELHGLSRWQVMRHVRRCGRCASALDETLELDAGLERALTDCQAPDYLTLAVMRRLPAMPPARRRWQTLPWWIGAGCAALQAAALWGAYRYGFSRTISLRAAPLPAVHRAAAPAAGVSGYRAAERTSLRPAVIQARGKPALFSQAAR